MKKTTALSVIAVAVLALTGCSVERPAVVKAHADTPAVVVDDAAGTDDTADEPPAPETAHLGDTVTVGNWDVKVTEVRSGADAVIAKANMFNDKAKGRYVLVTYQATYTGSDRIGDIEADLSWSFTTPDSKVVDEASVVTPADEAEWSTEARRGGTIKYQAVFDLPQDAVKGGILTVDGYDDNFDEVYADFEI